MKPHWPVPAGLHTASAQLPVESRLPSFEGATGWLNSPPLTADGLRGKVVLVNFWTYTCINWLRQLPYVRAWAGKYADQGLVVIGVHTPEFSFEHNPDNVRRAVQDDEGRLPGRDRQRLRGMECLRQPLLARPLLRRRAGAHPASPLRRGRVPAGRRWSSSSCWPRPDPVGTGHDLVAVDAPGCGSAGRLGHAEITGKLHRLRPHRELRLARRRRTGQVAPLYRPGAAEAQRLGAGR